MRMGDFNAIGDGVWKETGGEKEHIRREEEKREKIARIKEGLAECLVCGGTARMEYGFGYNEQGVWVGCDRTAECARYVEYHEGGWSLEEAAREWNRYNSGMYGVIRRVKRWVRLRIGRAEREYRRREREWEKEKEAKRERLREILGIKMVERRKRWWKVW